VVEAGVRGLGYTASVVFEEATVGSTGTGPEGTTAHGTGTAMEGKLQGGL
jgi:hypothetical protein